MIGDFKRLYRGFRLKAAQGNMNAETPAAPVPVPKTGAGVKALLEKDFNGSFDFKIKTFAGDTVVMAFIDGLVDKVMVEMSVVKPIQAVAGELKARKGEDRLPFLQGKLGPVSAVELLENFNDCVERIMSGDTLLFIDGSAAAIDIGLQKFEHRGVEESKSEAVTRGSREGFTEVLQINMTMIRRIIKDSRLVFELTRAGRQTKTNVAFCYIRGLANQAVVDEVRKRLRNIKAAEILESGYIEEYLTDHPTSIFPTVFNSERPQTVASKLLEGRVAVICDGTPVVLVVPCLFIDFMQFSEDYNSRFGLTAVIRLIRFTALYICTMAPAYYVALVCFHQDVIPFKLLLTVASARRGVPFPPLAEMLILTVLFEILKESGVRMPGVLGESVSIVGGLIIGQAAVQAGLVSTPAVVVVAATSLGSFIFSKLDSVTFILRVSLMFAANIIGILGVVLGSVAFFAYMCALKSFGVPYLSPLVPLDVKDMKDLVVRMPLWAMLEKPETVTRRYAGGDTRKGTN